MITLAAASRSRIALVLAALAVPLTACSAPAATPSTTPSATVAASSAPATSASPSASATSASPTPSATPTPTASGYTMAEVKKHAGAASCWSVVDGTVYDLTKWVSRHPGGRARILSMCGIDGTRLFHGEHGRESRPNKILAGYELGKLS